jgi:hypothetical protein
MQTQIKKSNNQITGNIGLFYACYKLSLYGWNVLPTSRNTAGIDIVIHNKNGNNLKTIQVKTLNYDKKGNNVNIGIDKTKISDGSIWLIVTYRASGTNPPSIYVMTGKMIKQKVNQYGWITRKVFEQYPAEKFWDKIIGMPD